VRSSYDGYTKLTADLNPRDFIAPWNAFELATYAVDNAVDVLVVP
jgi:protein N-terminal amidase